MTRTYGPRTVRNHSSGALATSESLPNDSRIHVATLMNNPIDTGIRNMAITSSAGKTIPSNVPWTLAAMVPSAAN
jgi:hypothetical protein